MTPERWQQIKAVLHEAIEMAPEQRSVFLERACADDPILRNEVESLLASNDAARNTFLQSPPLAPRSLAKGTRIGEYEIVLLIGSGGMGEVYKAHDLRLGRDVAVKVLPALLVFDPERLRRFEQEARAAAALNHPNILAVYQLGLFEGMPYLVSELLEGMTLREHIRSGALPLRKTIDYGMQIARGLAAAHEKGIVHRDLKPENIFVTKDGRVKILDFGLAKLITPEWQEAGPSDQTQAGTVIGTVGYMSPEQVRGLAVDYRTDIFSYGTIFYEMVTGKRAFPGDTTADTMSAVLKEDPPPLTQLVANFPPGLERVVFRCLEKSPEQRFHSASDLAFALDALSGISGANQLTPPPGFASPRGKLSMRWFWLALVMAALAFTVAGFRRFRQVTPPGNQIRSIAVLPLDNLSGDPGQDYFVEGMSDELTTQLANIGALRVVSRTSAMRYKQSNKSLPEIARELQVDAVIEGSVLRSGGSVRITTQLVQASSDKQLWARSYQRELKDVLRLQSELAHDIAEEIKVKITPQEQQRLASSRTVDPPAYEAYLKGRYHWNKGTEEGYREAMKDFQQAIALDPNYAPAYAGLADYYWATDELAPKDAMPRAKENVLKALTLDAGLAEGHETLAIIKFYGDWDWPGAESEFRKALTLNPSYAEGHRMFAVYLSELGRADEALQEIRSAEALDPLSLPTTVTAGWVLFYARQFDQAIQQCSNVVEMDASLAQAHDCLGYAYLALGDYPKAIAECKEAANQYSLDPLRQAGLARAYALAGESKKAREILDELEGRSRTQYVPPYVLAMLHAALGEKDQAFALLNRGYQEQDPYLVRLRVDEVVDPLRSDPRFAELVARIGLPEAGNSVARPASSGSK